MKEHQLKMPHPKALYPPYNEEAWFIANILKQGVKP
jgi:hypothetical protein